MGRSDDVSEMTGRVPLWNFVWHASEGRHIQGFGYGAFWVVDRTRAAWDALNWFPRHSHSAYLQTVVNLGLVGLAVVLAIGVITLCRAATLARRTGLAEYYALAAVVVGIFVNGVAESAFAMPRDMGLFAAAAVLSLAATRVATKSVTVAKSVLDEPQPGRRLVAVRRISRPVGLTSERRPAADLVR